MIGQFYLGLSYDYQQIWMQNQSSKSAVKDSRAKDSGVAIYPCSQEREFLATSPQGQKIKKRAIIDVYIVISESVFLVLEPE